MEIDLLHYAAGVGFPAALCVYLLTKFEATLEKLTIAINDLHSLIKNLSKK